MYAFEMGKKNNRIVLSTCTARTLRTHDSHSHNHNDMAFFIRHFFYFFSKLLRCVSFSLVYIRFYVGHPMKTVLFLALDRPAVSTLTYQSSYSGKTHAIHSFFFFSIFLCSKWYIFHCSTSHHHTQHVHIFVAETETYEHKIIKTKSKRKMRACVIWGRKFEFSWTRTFIDLEPIPTCYKY